MVLMYMGSRKRQDLLNKLGAWGSWERVQGEERGREESREKCIAQLNQLKKEKSNILEEFAVYYKLLNWVCVSM